MTHQSESIDRLATALSNVVTQFWWAPPPKGDVRLGQKPEPLFITGTKGVKILQAKRVSARKIVFDCTPGVLEYITACSPMALTALLTSFWQAGQRLHKLRFAMNQFKTSVDNEKSDAWVRTLQSEAVDDIDAVDAVENFLGRVNEYVSEGWGLFHLSQTLKDLKTVLDAMPQEAWRADNSKVIGIDSKETIIAAIGGGRPGGLTLSMSENMREYLNVFHPEKVRELFELRADWRAKEKEARDDIEAMLRLLDVRTGCMKKMPAKAKEAYEKMRGSLQVKDQPIPNGYEGAHAYA